MKNIFYGEQLLLLGIVVLAVAAIFGAALAIVLHLTGKRIRCQLENEFGKKRA